MTLRPLRIAYNRTNLLRSTLRMRELRRRSTEIGSRLSVQGLAEIDVADLRIGDDVAIWSKETTTLLAGVGRLDIGDRVFINSGAMLFAHEHLIIQDDVLIGLQAVIADSDMHGIEGKPIRTGPTTIGAGSWLGMRSIVLRGVTIGERSIVAAGAVVTKDVPAESLVEGNPAEFVRWLDLPAGESRAWNNQSG